MRARLWSCKRQCYEHEKNEREREGEQRERERACCWCKPFHVVEQQDMHEHQALHTQACSALVSMRTSQPHVTVLLSLCYVLDLRL